MSEISIHCSGENSHMPAPRRVWGVVLVLLACSASGCGASSVDLATVAGQITVDRAPLVSGTVVFTPDAERGNATVEVYRASVDGEGRYRIAAGVPRGWYRVAVFALRTPSGGIRPPEWLANQRYSDPKTSGLAVEVVVPPPAGSFDFDLKP
jgi:hypothetical protein